MTFTASVATEI